MRQYNITKRLVKVVFKEYLYIPKSTSRLQRRPPEPIQPNYGDNSVINHPTLNNSDIIFKGTNNILFCDPGITLEDSIIRFNGSNAVIYLSSNQKNIYTIKATVHSNCVLFMDRNNYFNGTAHFIASEQKHIIIGEENLFSFYCWFRNSDVHLIYDAKTKKRINPSKSILIGDHTWISQGATILKGTQIGSGSIIGAQSVVAGKRIESNASYGGNPAKYIKNNVFFARESSHAYTDEETEKMSTRDTTRRIYTRDGSTMSLDDIDTALRACTSSNEKLSFIQEKFTKKRHKNRFYIAGK